MGIAGKYGYSYNEEIYQGAFDTKEDAVAAADGSRHFWVGQYREPISPESCIGQLPPPKGDGLKD